MPMKLFNDGIAFAKHLAVLHDRRRKLTKGRAKTTRTSLSPAARAEVLRSTNARCHICGGEIAEGERWTADHVRPHARGGDAAINNHLPAHGLCNNYRWHYSPEELQWILKLGVWARTQIERKDPLALELATRFVRHERKRELRRTSA